MKTLTLVTVFAAGLAAQTQKDPRVELAQPIAIEEQERDLAKAEAAYREALEGELSPAARRLACERLGLLLLRLGRTEEGQQWLARSAGPKGAVISLDDVTAELQGLGQDVEREAALREKARVLVEKFYQAGERPGTIAMPGMDPDIAAQLLWIGPPAVPVIAAAIEKGPTELWPAAPLSRALWRIGGDRAQAFLAGQAAGERARLVAMTAGAAEQIHPEAPAVRACLRHEDPAVVRAFLESDHRGLPLHRFLDASDLVDAAARESASLRAFVLAALTTNKRELDGAQLARVHELVEQGLASTEPEYGLAAERFLLSAASQGSARGVELVLSRLPQLRASGVRIETPWSNGRIRTPQSNVRPQGAFPERSRPVPRAVPDEQEPFDALAAASLVPRIDAAIDALGPHGDGDAATAWLWELMRAVLASLADGADQLALQWTDRGYPLLSYFEGRITATNAAEVLARVAKLPSVGRAVSYRWFDGVELPAGTFEALHDLAEAEADPGVKLQLGRLMVRTGRADVVPWLLGLWRRDGASAASEVAAQVVEFGRHDRSETVRSAFDSLLRGFGGPKPGEDRRSDLLLAWLSMGDPRALDFVVVGAAQKGLRHPYAEHDTIQTPIQYVTYQDPEPPHGFTSEQVAATARRFFSADDNRSAFDVRTWSVPAIRDEALAGIAEGFGAGDATDAAVEWRKAALLRLGDRIAENRDAPALERWFLSALGTARRPDQWFFQVPEPVVLCYRDRIAALVDGDDESWAHRAVKVLSNADCPLDVAALLHNRHASVRRWAANVVAEGDTEVPATAMIACLDDDDEGVRVTAANHLGATVAKDAVPALIARLRDPFSTVREAAADALTRIRFYHEQQAHWDRVLKGLDASPASAAEKLLLQAKPAAPKQQRLLAIRSLGVLGAPEALPFLIEWTGDPDAEIAAEANAAITKIHLEPRK